jgi:hypothetical protein
MMTLRRLPLPFLVLLPTCLAACSTDDPGPPSDSENTARLCTASCPGTSGLDLTTPAVSFARDVFPIFAANCNQVACHGSTDGPKAALYHGPPADATPADITAVFDGLERASVAVNTMMLIAAGDPAGSFLMRKVEGCQNSLGLSCTQILPNECELPCGEPMPPLPRDVYPGLGQDDVNTIRRWIAQGAPP